MSNMDRDNNTPLVSVVSPVYNGRDFLIPYIDSVRAQTLKDWELILVDDGSTDDSAEIAELQAKQDPRIKVIRAEHQNAGNARNVGFEAARGKYTCFLDSDDECKPDMLLHMYEAAEKHDADMVLCLVDAYSEFYRETTNMTWAVRESLIPFTEDGCYNRHSCRENLFQSCIISPWNKMMRSEMLRKNGIKAQSQLAANDVVLSCMALACAERIYVLRENLYVQRRDYSGSITSNLGTKAKCMCGYTASLGLMEELKRLGLYDELRETYQKLAIHNCIWYLEKEYENVGIMRDYFKFLKEEGFSKLDLDDLERRVEYEGKQDNKEFEAVRSSDFEEYLYHMISNCRRKEESDELQLFKRKYQVLHYENSKAFRLGNGLLKTPRKVRYLGKTTRRIKRKNKSRTAGKRIAIVAFETFHYEVTENVMRICNLKDNFVAAYLNTPARREVSHMLGEKTSPLVEWHSFKKPNLKPQLSRTAEGEEVIEAFFNDICNKDIDCLIIPSVEYSPERYRMLIERMPSGIELILGVHNINSVFGPECSQLLKSVLDKADSYFVISSALKETMLSMGVDKKIYVFPPIYEGSVKRDIRAEKKPVVFTVTGIVDSNRKDYQSFVDALKSVEDIYPDIRVVLLGNADSDYGRSIKAQMEELRAKGLDYRMYFERILQPDFDEVLEETDCLVGPVVIETGYKGIAEYYGKTKASGIVGDIIKYALPAIVTGEMPVPEELGSSILQYDSTNDMGEKMRQLTDAKRLAEYKAEAVKNSEKFSLSSQLWK